MNSHHLSLQPKRDNFTREDLLGPAGRFKREAEVISDEITAVMADWRKYASQAEVEKGFSDELASNPRLGLYVKTKLRPS